MIELGTTSFYIQIPSLPSRELESFSTSLFDTWEGDVERALDLNDYALSLRIEEGSVKGLGKIATALGALYIGIGQYGSFVNGLQVIRSQVQTATTALTDNALSRLPEPSEAPKIRRSGAVLAKLHTLFHKVQRGQLSADDAMRKASALLGDDGAGSPEFMSALQSALQDAPLFPQQISLPYTPPDGAATELDRRQRVPAPPQPLPLPPVDHFRVEVWRDSKKSQRHVSLIKI